MKGIVKRPTFAIFAIAFVAYAYFYQAGGWNQNVRFDLVRSLVEKHSVVIDGYHRNSGDLSCHGDNGTCKGRAKAELHEHYYCDKAPGVSVLGVIPYSIYYGISQNEKPSANALANNAYVSTLVSIALPSALSVAFLFSLLLLLGAKPWASVFLSIGYGLATISFPYSTLLYGHQTAAALLFIGFALLVRARHQGSDPPMLIVFLCLGFSVVCEYPAGLAVLPISIYAFVYFRSWKGLTRFIAGGTICAAFLGGYHWLAFGGPMTLPYEFSTQHFRGLGYFMGLGAPNWPAFSNTMFTSYRGLFFSAPWLLLMFPGAYFMIRSKRLRAEGIVCLSIFLLFLWMTSSLIDSWHGGWSMGARYMIPAIPFMVLLIGGLALHPRIANITESTNRWIVRSLWVLSVGLVSYSGLLMLQATAVRPEVPQQIKQPFAKYLTPNFYAGTLATNTQGIDMIGPPRGTPPQKAWNLGHKIGLKGLTSLLPLMLMWLALAGWLAVAMRHQRREEE